MDMDFYVSFSSFVQFVIAFDFGLLYLEYKKIAIFTDIQVIMFDSFRNNYFVKQFLHYAVKNKEIKTGFMKKWNSVLNVMKTKIEAALGFERTCDYLVVLGIISGIYGLSWLLLVPWACNHSRGFIDFYMTLTMCTVVTECLMLLKVICRKNMTQAKAFIQSTFVLMLSYFIGYLLYKNGVAIDSPMKFDSFFLVSMLVVYAPLSVYICHLLISILFRVITLISLLLLACAYKLVAIFY